MAAELESVSQLATTLEKDRVEKFGELSQLELATSRRHPGANNEQLMEALAAQRQGQWGERMAEDIMRLAGLIENVNYVRQKTIEHGLASDFTFLLPKDLSSIWMKFPRQLRQVCRSTDRHEKGRFETIFARCQDTDERSDDPGIYQSEQTRSIMLSSYPMNRSSHSSTSRTALS
jgi:DNA recombination protein RmuC